MVIEFLEQGVALWSRIFGRPAFPIVGIRFRHFLCRDPSLLLAVVIIEKVVKDLGQPRFHIGSGGELILSREGTNKSLLDEIFGVGWIFYQVECNPIQMIEVNHGFIRKRVPPGASHFWLPEHAGILTNERASV